MFIIGIVCFMLAAASGIYIDRQRFNRRNAAGVEEFDSYNAKMKARTVEGLTQAIGTVAGLAGMFCIAKGLWNM